MLGQIYWAGEFHTCCDVTIGQEDHPRFFKDAQFKFYTRECLPGETYRALVNNKNYTTEQVDTPYARRKYQAFYDRLAFDRVLNIGLGLHLGDSSKLADTQMVFVEKSLDVIRNVPTKHEVVQGDICDMIESGELESLGWFNIIFLDATDTRFHIQSSDFFKVLRPQGQIVWLT